MREYVTRTSHADHLDMVAEEIRTIAISVEEHELLGPQRSRLEVVGWLYEYALTLNADATALRRHQDQRELDRVVQQGAPTRRLITELVTEIDAVVNDNGHKEQE